MDLKKITTIIAVIFIGIIVLFNALLLYLSFGGKMWVILTTPNASNYPKVLLAVDYATQKTERGSGYAVRFHGTTESTHLQRTLNHSNKLAAAA